MTKIKLTVDDENKFIKISEETGVFIEGNILKCIEGSEKFEGYLKKALQADTDARKRRLSLTKVVQEKNDSLEDKIKENELLVGEIKEALEDAENAKKEALNDLDLMHRRSQFELINTIVSYALYVIVGTGIITTGLYGMAIWYNSNETTLIGNTWSNLLGILLTNSFSIIGTIMGVKYANKSEESKNVSA